MEKFKCFIIAIGVVSAVVLITVIVLAVVLTQSPANEQNNLNDRLSETATFPNGSFYVAIDSIKSGSLAMAPKNITETQLNSWGIRVDDSSVVAEAGRLSFFYIWLPPSADTEDREKRSPNQLNKVSTIGSIGIRFGNSRTLNVVPLSAASTARSGFSLIRILPDSSALYELQIRMPTSMCSNGDSESCKVISWQPYSLSRDNQLGQSNNFRTSLPVACGSQCESEPNSPCAKSTCQSCDGQQVAGADTPVTRRYNLGTSSGTLNFQYETFSVKDRVTVVYEGQTIMDSGCVGTSGIRNTNIRFSGKSKELRVDVEPNCEGTTGTAWWFTLPCPSPCSEQRSSNRAVLMSGGINEVASGGIVYITKEGQMPALTAYFCDGTSSVIWTLVIRAAAPCSDQSFSGLGSTWAISQSYGTVLQGGDATLSWTVTQNPTDSGSMSFFIRGTQPIASDVVNEITRQSTLWYSEYVAKHESNLRQFDTNGKPLTSYDNGVGIFQLTNPPPTCADLWSWKANVQEGVRRLAGFDIQATTWMARQRKQASDQGYAGVPVPATTEANCIFRQNTSRVIEHAVAMKMFNGASGGNYCAWDDKNFLWKFNRLNVVPNGQSFNYVNRVCQKVPSF